MTPSKALTTTTGRSPDARWRVTTSTAAAMSSGWRRTDPPNLSTTTPSDRSARLMGDPAAQLLEGMTRMILSFDPLEVVR